MSSQSLNDHAAYAEWGDNNLDTLSAESVALSLITKFSDKQLPRASDLLWLVSEQVTKEKWLCAGDFLIFCFFFVQGCSTKNVTTAW